jgi:hypothetical protein
VDKKKSEMVQIAIFGVIFAGQVFLVTRYYPRGDMVGVALFSIVAVLSAVAAFGHFLEWKKAK